MKPVIENMRPAHWEGVRAAYLEGIATRNATFETDAPDWSCWDTAHLNFARLVALAGEQVAGWAALAPVSGRKVYAGVADVSIYVGERFRGEGVGRILLEALIAESESNGIWTLQAGIFPENAASVALHQSYGFREVGRRERIAKLDGRWRDTILLERRSKVVGSE